MGFLIKAMAFVSISFGKHQQIHSYHAEFRPTASVELMNLRKDSYAIPYIPKRCMQVSFIKRGPETDSLDHSWHNFYSTCGSFKLISEDRGSRGNIFAGAYFL